MNKIIQTLKIDDNSVQDLLREVRNEITRINKAAGETVFNPSATESVDLLIRVFNELAAE